MTAPERRLSVLALCPYLPFPPDHGGRIRTFLLLRELVRRGHEVTLLALLGAEDAGRDADGLRAEGIRVVTVPHERRFGALTWSDRLRKLGNLIKGRSDVLARYWSDAAVETARGLGAFDVAVAEGLWTAPLAMAVDASARVLNAHNVESMIADRIAAATDGGTARAAAAREASGLKRDEAEYGARFDAVAVVSEDDRRGFLDLAPEASVEVVGNCVDTDALALLPLPRDGGEIRCLFIGTPSYAPNGDAVAWFVREVLPRVREGGRPVRFDVVGANPPESWRQLAAEHEGVNLLGYVVDVVDAYRSATQVVVPIRVGGGTRLKILEALALGRPVVSTTVGAEGLGLKHGTHALIADDSAAFSEAILRLANDESVVARMVRAGRDHVENVGSATAMGEAFERLLLDAHARRRRGG